jgi:MFS family permease
MSNKNKAIISTCAASVVGMIALVTTAVLAYIIQDYASQGVAVATIVSMMTIQPLVGVFMAFIVGPISMRVSKKLILMFALLLVIINGVIFSIFGGNCSIYWLLFASALTGIVSGVISTVPNSIVSEYAESWDERGKFTGWNNAFMQGGALIMSAVGGILGATRWQNAYYLYFLAVPALLIVAILCPMDHPAADKANAQKLDFGKIPGKVWLMCVHYVIFFICCYTFSVYISSYIITDFALGTSAQSGLAAALLTISAVLAATFYSNYNKKLGKWFMPFFCLTMGIGYLLCSTLTTTLAGCMIGAFLIGIGKSAVVPYVIGEATSRAPRYMTPMIISLIMGSMSLGMFLSKYITGWMCNFLGGETTYNRFVATTIICGIAIILGFLIYTLDKKPETETAKAKA